MVKVARTQIIPAGEGVRHVEVPPPTIRLQTIAEPPPPTEGHSPPVLPEVPTDSPDLPSVAPAAALSSPVALTSETFALMLEEETRKRALLRGYIGSHLAAGVDFGTIPFGNGRVSKPSLFKPGAEKICSLLNLKPEFQRDGEFYEMLGDQAKGWIAFVCRLFTIHGAIAGEGRGAAGPRHVDLNTRLKMAQKSAQIDATLRVQALSDYFTQDLEDLPPETLAPHPQASPAPAPQPPPVSGDPTPYGTAPSGPPRKPISDKQAGEIHRRAREKGYGEDDVKEIALREFGCPVSELSSRQASAMIDSVANWKPKPFEQHDAHAQAPPADALLGHDDETIDRKIAECRGKTGEGDTKRLGDLCRLICDFGGKTYAQAPAIFLRAENFLKLAKGWQQDGPTYNVNWAAIEGKLVDWARKAATDARESAKSPTPF